MTTIPVDCADEAVQGYEYLHEYKILVCKDHGFGLRDLRRHLLEQHSYSRYARDAIIERFGKLTLSIRKMHHSRRQGPSRSKVCCPRDWLCVVPVGQVKLASSRAPARKGWPGTATNTDGDQTSESVSIGSQ